MSDKQKVLMVGEKPKRAPTLYFIIAGKLFKGTLALALAFEITRLIGRDLSDLFNRLVTWVHLDPENRFFSEIGDRLDQITPANVRWVAVATFVYSLISFVEGIGLMFRVSWAGWLAIGESAFFIPIEVRELVRHPHWYVLGVLAFNVLIVWYLYANRTWLFRHHH
ncbi:MAG TPA: DUF2127 domain-containing protein [Verrucomicrobiae bacterium]